MSPLSYLGSGAMPGMSMPAAVPGPPTGAPNPLAGILGGGGAPPPPGVMGLQSPNAGQAGDQSPYLAEAQADGTILVRIRNPDGTPGPALRIVQGPKPKRI